ncbi:unnamed protein product, partial [Prorocentrum cordatum]
MERTVSIFGWIFGADPPETRTPYRLSYLATPNVGLHEEALRARAEHERRGARRVACELAPACPTLRLVHGFLTAQPRLPLRPAAGSPGRASGDGGARRAAAAELWRGEAVSATALGHALRATNTSYDRFVSCRPATTPPHGCIPRRASATENAPKAAGSRLSGPEAR